MEFTVSTEAFDLISVAGSGLFGFHSGAARTGQRPYSFGLGIASLQKIHVALNSLQ
jgi:hypothetical protein